MAGGEASTVGATRRSDGVRRPPGDNRPVIDPVPVPLQRAVVSLLPANMYRRHLGRSKTRDAVHENGVEIAMQARSL